MLHRFMSLLPATLLLALQVAPTIHAADIPPPRARIVIVFGDSITAGGALPKDQRDRLWVKLVEDRSNGAFKLVNEGKGGRPTASLGEFTAMLQRQAKANHLLIALGTNDSRDITAACVPKAVANVRSMIEKARASYGAAVKITLIGPPNLNKSALVATKPIANERDAKLQELGTAYAKLATETQCRFLSLYGVVPESSMTKDGVHPDATGNEAIATAVLKHLQGW